MNQEAQQQAPQRGGALTVRDAREVLSKCEARVREVVPKGVDAGRLVKMACAYIAVQAMTNDLILKCTPQSLQLTLCESARLGLPLGGPLARAHAVPFWSKKVGGYEAKMIVDFKGYVELALRSGKVSKIESQVVYENDMFALEFGDTPRLVHVPHLDPSKRGACVGAYAIAWLCNGAIVREFVHESDIQKIKNVSLSKQKGESKSGPWISDEDQMRRKTAVRRLQKYLPLTEMPELMAAMESDLAAEGYDDPVDAGVAERVAQRHDVPPANRVIGHRQAAEAKTRQEAPSAASEPMGGPAGPSGDSGEPLDGDGAGDGTLFADSDDPGANESREVPLDGAEAAKAGGFSQHDNPHVGGEARKKWLADFNAEAKK